MALPLKSLDFKPPSPPVEICLKCESPLQEDITNSHYTPHPLKFKKVLHLQTNQDVYLIAHNIYNIFEW